MKYSVLIFFAVLSIKISAQSTLLITNITNTNLPQTVAANSEVLVNTKKYTTKDLTFDLKNTGSVRSAYKVKRYDILLNQTGTADSAIAHFCFGGSCFLSSPSISPGADSLDSGQSASSLIGLNKVLDADLDEGGVIGYSHVKYTFFNTGVANDTIQFSIKYNAPPTTTTSIKEADKSLISFDVFPNPVKDIATIKINSVKTFNSKVVIYNALGLTVYEKDLSINEGKNKIDINVETLPSGIYFANIRTETNSILTKKIIVQ